ncbi:putative fasciclin-like arabinogalactan protein [Helianthus annuus]|uniref:Fasciclin-like arabinogalactan protein n=1 Tax=Helianthus annuus TaxID=4232 RepID=A0A251RRX3_HELAN|nr:fasciclin-like arabinogalactan protein 8 [Helianthus annuus]KAF5756832.1 putative fasciclin-like arabinogalactan protein [Helianthus annuus]KAJ0430275.1 putative fasciclin-like arabinogalactan protein [Helianthus annuus]KAJ0435107.1 putative fasciclin-like arabinogalactan protein [Helianthus annuus]KAJ0448700.1 putative fasciclin-like arabinogalactan protein [Helianthus annuus]KAJ0633582.1 putative fasciclin-like arabinogalactan protein [Helianthus annuus]
MSALRFIFLIATILTVMTVVTAHNITAILSEFPEYSEFNHYLSETKLDDEINSRETITVLVLNNGVVSSLAGKHPLSVIKGVLSLHILLDYYDNKKLHAISDGTTLSTTLFQTTGNAPGDVGFVNITDLKGGKVGFGSAVAGSKLDSTYTKSVKQIPYNISVLEINEPIIAPGILTAPAPSADVNITGLLEKAGCKTFVKLITETGVLKVYQLAAAKGLTVFAPNDEAFKAAGVPDLSQLSNAELVALLQYHALASYTPKGSLKTTKDPLSTLATNGAGKYDLTVETAGDSVTLDSGVGTSRVASTVLDSTPLCIFTVDNVLLPTELFGKSPSPAPSLSPDVSPASAPAPDVLSPEPAAAPSPFLSPPAPPTEAPAGGPAPSDGPTADSENSNANTNGVDGVRALTLTTLGLVATSVSVMISFVLC